MAKKRSRRRGSDVGDLRILAVSSEGEVLLGLPGGGAITLSMPPSLIPFYRRLIPGLAEDS